ncbi:MAG: kelch repeat-containing protein [Gemmatimonas sp.]
MRLVRLFAFCAVISCGGSNESGTTNPPAPAPVATVTVAAVSGGGNIVAGGSTQLSAVLRDAQNSVLSGRAVTWSSTAEAVALVSSSGTVTAVAPGSATIRASSEGKTGDFPVTVTVAPWTTTGSLAAGRTLHTATVLANGRVLVVGGQTIGAPFSTFASAELYDPNAGTWSATGSLATPRENHIAVRLANGKVLIAGGYSIEQQVRLRSAEIYDPAAGTWSSASNLSVARDNAVAHLLGDGRVLVVGGSGTGSDLAALNSAEVYDPVGNSWTAVGNMSVARAGHTSVLLNNGKVLVAGGASGSFTTPVLHASAEVFDPVANTFSASGTFATGRAYARAALLASGRVLLTGGSNVTSSTFAASDLYDPSTNAWTATAALSIGRLSHTATTLGSGRVLVAGGAGTTGGPQATVEIFDPASGTWANGPAMRVARSNHAAVLLANGKVLVVGGQGTGASSSAELFDPTAPMTSRSPADSRAITR